MLSHLFAGFISLIARLPLWALHSLSSFAAFLLTHVIRYRRKIVLANLRNSFPEKGEREIRKIARGFYRHLTDVAAETIKLKTISDQEILRRCRVCEEGRQALSRHYEQGSSLIGLLGHFGNWEWVPPVTSLNFPFLVVPAYRPLKNKPFDRLMLRIRSRYSHELIPKKNVGRASVRYIHSKKPFVLGLIADQTPQPGTAFWTTFLSQDTPVYSGPEKLARSMKLPVFFVALRRQRRGHYFFHIELLSDKPWELQEGELSARFMELLEKEIRAEPAHWLWSHRRWKHTRKSLEAQG